MRIDYKIWKAAKANGITLDLMGQPLKIGDKVLVKGYYSVNMDTIATITKINKVNLKVDIPKRVFRGKAYDEAYDKFRIARLNGDMLISPPLWSDYYDTIVSGTSRNPYDVIKANDLEASAMKAVDDLAEEYPEVFV